MSMGVITTRFGRISGIEAAGERYAGIVSYNGIPYAAPPVGELRWKPPVDPAPWEGVRECVKYAPRCPQVTHTGLGFEPYSSDFYYMGYPEMNEDCLYLNVTTGAASADEKRPVLMWFHGGGLASGHSYEVEFDPNELARKGIIVVTVGQRLNIFGYLTLPQLAQEQDGRCGNYGLMDEVKALDWVSENIAAFGGDPENITIAGQSGGTWKTGALAASPEQKGRVKRVINQSGLCWRRHIPTMEQQQQNDTAYLSSIGIDPNLPLSELRKIPAEDLLKASGSPFGQGPRLPSEMVCDGKYIATTDLAENLDRYAGDCDYLTGGNYGETHMGGSLFSPIKVESREVILREAKKMLGDLYEKYDFESMIPADGVNFNHISRWLAGLGLSGAPLLGNLAIERIFGAQRAKAHPASNTYTYYFTHVTPDRPEDKGTVRDRDNLLAWHSSELWYTFASLRKGVPLCRPWTEQDFTLADQISQYWANFIRTGNPNGEGLPFWPKSDESYGWMDLGDTFAGHDHIEDGTDRMLLEYAEKVLETFAKGK